MKIFHNKDWNYTVDGKTFFKVGAYDEFDDLEYISQKDGSIYLPEIEKYYSSLEKAYETENERWISCEVGGEHLNEEIDYI